MIPAKFSYIRAESLDEAVQALDGAGEDTKVLAGGQSLLPLLRLRLAYPEAIVDLTRVTELRGVRDEGEKLWIGAGTTHHELLRDPLVKQHAGLLTQTAATVADPAVRHRGTLGGSLAHADPAGDLPAAVLALDGSLVVRGPGGEREIPASAFFVDYLTSVLRPAEIVTGIRVPKRGAEWSYHYEKFNRTAQAWAIVGVAAAVRRSDGVVNLAQVGLTNMGPTPLRAEATEAAIFETGGAGADDLRRAAEQAHVGTSPPNDLHGQADFRQHLVRVLTARALLTASRL